MQITDFIYLVNFWSQSVKIDVKDLAYALKVQDCPQILFLRGNRIIYRERGETLISLYRVAKGMVVFIHLLDIMQVIVSCYAVTDLADFRSADELVQMIAHFYYNAKKLPCVK